MELQFDFGDGGATDAAARVEPLGPPGHRLVIGTCGYSYAEWVGRFYPARMKQRDMLPYYARYFSAVEIDGSYYRVPTRASLEAMAERTPADFRFAIKLPGTLTHAPADELGGALHPDAAAFAQAVGAFAQRGRLLAVLAQFPGGFRPGGAAREHLARLRDAFATLPLAFEFRHRSWQTPGTLADLRGADVAWTNVDQPGHAALLRPSCDVTSERAYVRFHGRNAEQWWEPATPSARYDYRYDDAELAPWARRLVEASATARETLAFFNNHAYANAVVDARRLAELVRLRLTPADAARAGTVMGEDADD